MVGWGSCRSFAGRCPTRIPAQAIAVLAAILLVAAGYLLGAARSTPEVPRDGAVDVGFLRDMMVHHAQAVTLAMIVDRRAAQACKSRPCPEPIRPGPDRTLRARA
jgi:uncharacterized protein (DUF305 family)